jgi:hypothetical protein
MAFTNFHPAPGFGQLMPGDFVVPQNPISRAERGVGYVARMGELLPGSFSVPQNPIVRNFQTGMQGMGTMGCAGGMGCEGAGFTGSLAGLGEISLPSIDLASFNPSTWDKTTWYMVGGGVLLLLLMMRPGQSERLRSAKEAYRSQVAAIKAGSKRRVSRWAEGAKAAAAAIKGEE